MSNQRVSIDEAIQGGECRLRTVMRMLLRDRIEAVNLFRDLGAELGPWPMDRAIQYCSHALSHLPDDPESREAAITGHLEDLLTISQVSVGYLVFGDEIIHVH